MINFFYDDFGSIIGVSIDFEDFYVRILMNKLFDGLVEEEGLFF